LDSVKSLVVDQGQGCGVIRTHNAEVFCAMQDAGLNLCGRHDGYVRDE
jgi:hypothetical protein